jgi:uncharacterized membrane protein
MEMIDLALVLSTKFKFIYSKTKVVFGVLWILGHCMKNSVTVVDCVVCQFK